MVQEITELHCGLLATKEQRKGVIHIPLVEIRPLILWYAGLTIAKKDICENWAKRRPHGHAVYLSVHTVVKANLYILSTLEKQLFDDGFINGRWGHFITAIKGVQTNVDGFEDRHIRK